MQAENLITAVRRYLKDVTSDSVKGEFWSDDEIVLTLNLSQDMFLNYSISTEKNYLINSLIRNTTFSTGTITLSALTASYLHYMSAKVGTTEALSRLAQVYLGGTGWGFLNVDHRAAVIINDTCTFYQDRASTNGILYYYTHPALITDDNTHAQYGIIDFESFVYTDIISKHAATVLAMKETQTQREFKENLYKKMRQIVETDIYVRYTGKDIKEVVDATMNQQPPLYVNAQNQGRQI